jgi:hypothetical protein
MQERDVAVGIILTIITCGIYGIYWFIVLTDETKEASGDSDLASGGMALILTIITCGIYSFYWAYKMGKLLKIANEKHNIQSDDDSLIFIVLQIFGLGIVNYALIQNGLNGIYRSQKA